jgi:hypothetical protein
MDLPCGLWDCRANVTTQQSKGVFLTNVLDQIFIFIRQILTNI